MDREKEKLVNQTRTQPAHIPRQPAHIPPQPPSHVYRPSWPNHIYRPSWSSHIYRPAGPAMYTAHIPLHPVDYVALDCCITNPADVCIECNHIYIYILRSILRSATDGFALFNAASKLAISTSIRHLVKIVQEMKEPPRASHNADGPQTTGRSKGWCLNGLYCTFVCLIHFKTYEKAMAWIVQHSDSDTDTNACIAGAVLGALFSIREGETYGIQYLHGTDMRYHHRRNAARTDLRSKQF